MKTESSSQTEETMTLGQRGTYTITFVLHSACVSVCVLNEDTATLCFFLFLIKRPTHTLTDTRFQIGACLLAVGTCTCKASVGPAQAELRGKGAREEGGRENKMYVNRQTHRQTYRQALEHFERLKTPPVFDPAPAPLVSHVHSSTRGAL